MLKIATEGDKETMPVTIEDLRKLVEGRSSRSTRSGNTVVNLGERILLHHLPTKKDKVLKVIASDDNQNRQCIRVEGEGPWMPVEQFELPKA